MEELMTRRDHFAAVAFRELLIRHAAWLGTDGFELKWDRIELVAKDAYRMADALEKASGNDGIEAQVAQWQGEDVGGLSAHIPASHKVNLAADSGTTGQAEVAGWHERNRVPLPPELAPG